jgi:hypothetical protein
MLCVARPIRTNGLVLLLALAIQPVEERQEDDADDEYEYGRTFKHGVSPCR